MLFIEFIGFIIIMIAFFFLAMKQAREAQQRREEHPEEYEEEIEEQEAAIRELLESLDIELEKEESPPEKPKPKAKPQPPQPVQPVLIQDKKIFETPHQLTRKEREPEHDRAYEILKYQQSRVKDLLGKPNSLRRAIILSEIIGSPRSMNPYDKR